MLPHKKEEMELVEKRFNFTVNYKGKKYTISICKFWNNVDRIYRSGATHKIFAGDFFYTNC